MEKLNFEIWKQIPDHIGYEVSNFGRIRSYYNNGGKLCHESHLLKPTKTEKDILEFTLEKIKKEECGSYID